MAARASDPLICACFLLLLSLFNCSVVASRGPDTMGSQAPSPLEENGGVGSAEAPAPSAGPGLVDYQAMIKATQQLGLPRLEAYLRRVSGILDSSGKSTVGPASAPEAATSVEAPTQQRNEAIPPVLDSNEGGSKPPSFQGKPFIRTRADTMLYTRQMQDAKKAKAEGKAAPLVFPIIYLDQLEQLDDKEAGAIFHLGTAEIPSSISKNKFAYCDRDLTLTHSIEKPTNYPRFKFPEADGIFNDISRIFWHGKFFVPDPDTKKIQLFNLIFNDDTVGFLAQVNKVSPGFHPDGKDSFVVNYTTSEIFPLHVGLDEFRRVGPTIFLGSGIGYLDIRKILPQYDGKLGTTQALLNVLKPLIDGTQALLSNAEQVYRSLANKSNWTNINYPPTGFLPFSFYFAVDCQDYRIPKLQYTPIVNDALIHIEKFVGYFPTNHTAPRLPAEFSDTNWDVNTPKYQATAFNPSDEESTHVADPNAPNFGIRFDEAAAKVDPYVMFPWLLTPKDTNKSDTQATPGFLQLPARILEPAFGKYWSRMPEAGPALARAPEPEVKIYYADTAEAASPEDLELADEEENLKGFDDDLRKAFAPSPHATIS